MGRSTASIDHADDWVETLDQFGLLSERAVLLDQLTAEQNLAMPLSLALDELPDEVRARVKRLAAEVGLRDAELREADARACRPLTRLRVRLGRALALDPRVLLAEHPNASLSPADVPAFAADLSRVVAARRIASLVITANQRLRARCRRRGAYAPAGDRGAEARRMAELVRLGVERNLDSPLSGRV